MLTSAQIDAAEKAYGVTVIPGLGMAYAELKPIMADLFTKRAAIIPWIDNGWVSAVSTLQKNNPNDLVVANPSNGKSGIANKTAPSWQNAEQRAVWTEFASVCQSAIAAYAQGQQEAGKSALNGLYRNAAFWDRAYKIAVATRDAVPNAIGFVGSSLWNGLGAKWKIIIGLGLVGAGVYFALPYIKGVKSLKSILGK